jgi:hypothetical protein
MTGHDRNAPPPESVPPLFGMPPTARETAAEVVTEYGHLMSGGGVHVWPLTPLVLKVYPLAERIEHANMHGGKALRRKVIVVSDWEEVDKP